MDLVRKAYPDAKVILVELGDFAAPYDAPGKVKIRTYVRALDKLGYDAVGIGESEIAGGLDAYDEFFSKASFPAISGTFTQRGTETTFLKPYVVKTYALKGGRSIRVAFLSLSAYNSLLARTGQGGKVVVSRDPADQARRYASELSGKADLVVLLANLSPGDLKRVATAAPGKIQIALAAFGDRLSMGDVENIEGIQAFYAGNEGKRLGEVRVFLDGTRVRQVKAAPVQLTRRYPESPDFAKMVADATLEVNEIMKGLAATVPASRPAPAASRAATQPPADAAGEPPPAARRYMTSSACIDCHKDAFRVWDHSAHATALVTLVKANQDFNPECVKCHVTGFNVPSGFESARTTPSMANVQCEACHGIGSAHVADTSKPYGRVAPRVCYSCHTKENSPDFSFFKYWEQIKH